MSKAHIDKDAIGNYTPSAYPELFKIVGLQGLQDIQKHDEDAANIVAAQTDCGEITYVGYSKIKSDYPKVIASFVDCKNGKRFYVVNRQIEK